MLRGIEFQIIGPRYLNEFCPLRTEFTNTNGIVKSYYLDRVL